MASLAINERQKESLADGWDAATLPEVTAVSGIERHWNETETI